MTNSAHFATCIEEWLHHLTSSKPDRGEAWAEFDNACTVLLIDVLRGHKSDAQAKEGIHLSTTTL
jgi:hypothetical protein